MRTSLLSLTPLVLLCIVCGCGGESAPSPARQPAAVAGEWWSAAASGDAARIGACVSGDAARRKSEAVSAEYARVAKAAGEGDPLAVKMLARLERVRLGEVRSGSELAMAPLVLEDGKVFLTLRLEPRDGRWVIVDVK